LKLLLISKVCKHARNELKQNEKIKDWKHEHPKIIKEKDKSKNKFEPDIIKFKLHWNAKGKESVSQLNNKEDQEYRLEQSIVKLN
jgi:hypothetical protein